MNGWSRFLNGQLKAPVHGTQEQANMPVERARKERISRRQPITILFRAKQHGMKQARDDVFVGLVSQHQ